MTMTVKPSNGFGREVINNAVVFGSIFVFAFVAFSLFYPITSSYADDMDVNVVVEPTLSMSLSDSEINLDVDASNYGNVVESDPLTVNVSTNNRTGYSLTLNGSNIQVPPEPEPDPNAETRTLADISTMQAITEDICRNTPLYSVSNTTYELTDTRDNNIYSIRRLDDGNCWMVENLKLKGGTTITPEDSDVTENFTLPESSVANMTYDNEYIPLMYDGLDKDNDGVTDDNYDLFGAYYNWYTATANSGTYNVPGNAPSSICAKGWKLPTDDNYNELLWDDGEYLDSSEIDAMNVVFAYYYFVSNDGGSYASDDLASGEYSTPDQVNITYYYYRADDGSINHGYYNWSGEVTSVRCIATVSKPISEPIIPYSDLKPTSSQNTTTIRAIPTQISRNTWQSSSDYNNQYGFTHDNINLLTSDNFIPVYTDTNPTTIKNTDSASKNSNTNISFATKIDSNQLAGNYSNNITISAVANYDMFDWKNPFGILYMQQMTSKICSNATTPSSSATDLDTDGSHRGDPNYVPQATLIDTRGDGQGHEQIYVVRKLADGNCWMSQNLNLFLTAGNELTSNDTDLNSMDSWDPGTTTAIDDLDTEGYQNVPEGYETNTSSTSYYRGDKNCYGEELGIKQPCIIDGVSSGSSHVGILYNSFAATAGTDIYNDNEYVDDSICPKGWQLPEGKYYGDDRLNANGNRFTYDNLANIYGIEDHYTTNPSVALKLRQSPLNFVLSGYYRNHNIYNEGENGYYWTASASRGGYSYSMNVRVDYYSSYANFMKGYGFSVRCVAR